jgi:hypothetical protein
MTWRAGQAPLRCEATLFGFYDFAHCQQLAHHLMV